MRFLAVAACLLPVLGCVATPTDGAEASTGALIGGEAALPGQFPSTLFLGSCTGAKVGPRHILTAGHCVADESDVAVRTSYLPGARIRVTNDVEAGSPNARLLEVTVAKTWLHRGHRTPRLASETTDVAVVEIDEESASQLADIPVVSIDTTPLRERDDVLLMGYGCETLSFDLHHRLHWAKSRVDSEGIAPYDPDHVRPALPTFFFTRGLGWGKASGCPGDSGGPVYRDGAGKRVIAGINAWVPPGHFYTAHTRVDSESQFDVGSWLASIPGVSVEGPISDHFSDCTDEEMSVCGAIGRARAADPAAFGAPRAVPRWTTAADGERRWRQDFAQRRVEITASGELVVTSCADATCE